MLLQSYLQVPRPFEGILVLAIGVAESIRARIGWGTPCPVLFGKRRE